MKSFNLLKHIQLAVVALLVAFYGCSPISNDDDAEVLSEEDIQVSAEIIGESLSDENSGIMSSMYDALSDINESGISYGNSLAKSKIQSDRDIEREFTHTYDPETGIHTISFSRVVTKGDFSHSVTVLNKYIFTDPEGEFIARPKANKDSIEAIYFVGDKTGSHIGPVRTSEFSRIDTMDINGLHSSSAFLMLRGDHYGNGSASIENDRVSSSRSYRMHVSFDGISIDKAIVAENGNLEEGVTGTVSYTMYIVKTHGDRETEKRVEGVIEFDGDGTALLRFNKIQRLFRIFLNSGEVDEMS